MEVDAETPVVVAASETVSDVKMASPEKVEPTEAKSPVKEDSPKSIPTVGDHKKNGTLAGVAAAAAATAAAAKKEEARAAMSGIVVQFPEMFSLKRDRHILEKFEDADDVRLQKIAFVECESEEAAIQLQAKLNNSSVNDKKVIASRLDTTEKNVLYLGALKKETTDEVLKENLPGIQEILREKYNTFVLFTSETECRAARSKVIKEGINSQTVHCDFDLRKDRFKAPEEPAAKKPKEDGDAEKAEEEKKEEVVEEEKKEVSEEVKGEGEEEEVTKGEEEADVKADEW